MNGDDTYQRSAIDQFVGTQRNLEFAYMEGWQDDPLLADVEGPLDLLYRYTDDVQHTPALAFRHVTDDLYRLIYVDPGIAALWSDEME